MTLTILLLTITLQLSAPEFRCGYIEKPEKVQPYEALWRAVCIVESNNDIRAFNKKELAYGIAQIRKVRVDHYNRLTGSHYKVIDCYNPEISKKIFMYFVTSDLEQTAKSWNGKGRQTVSYWNKVKKYL